MISGFCRDLAGYSFIQQGNYKIWNSEDDKVISREDIAESLGPGMKVEMSIVLRAKAERRQASQVHTCPRCKHVSRKYVTTAGWLDW